MSYFFSSVTGFFSRDEQNDASALGGAEDIEQISEKVDELQTQQDELSSRQRRYEEAQIAALSQEQTHREQQSSLRFERPR
jgi:hypothetical protein